MALSRPAAKADQCSFWISQKHRYCNLTLSADKSSQLCGNHQLFDTNGNQLRFPCPYTKTHTVGKAEMKKHLFICDFRPPVVRPNYFSLNCNQGYEKINPIITVSTLASISKDQFDAIRSKITHLYHTLIPHDYEKQVLTHPVLSDRMNESHGGKHASQQSSLIGHLKSLTLLEKSNVFIEFGCGSGEFSKYVFEAIEPCHLVFVDRNTVKLKIGKRIKTQSWQKVVIDIKDLDLQTLMGDRRSGTVAISKHLCGCATDLTLRCLLNYRKAGGDIQGLVIALCCHQLCTYESYINREYLTTNSISKECFEYIALVSTWAICGPSKSQEKIHWTGLDFIERQNLGFKCKRILDLGRLDALQKSGANEAKLVYYVEKDSSLENLCLQATWK